MRDELLYRIAREAQRPVAEPMGEAELRTAPIHPALRDGEHRGCLIHRQQLIAVRARIVRTFVVVVTQKAREQLSFERLAPREQFAEFGAREV